MIYQPSPQFGQTLPFRIRLKPTPKRQDLVAALEELVTARELPIFLTTRHDSLVMGVILPSLGDQVHSFAELLGGRLHTGPVTDVLPDGSLLPEERDVLVLVALGDEYQGLEHFQHSVPGQIHSWTNTVQGLRLSDRPVARASTIVWGRAIAGELLVSTFLGVSVLVRPDEDVDAAALKEKCDALARTLKSRYYWTFARSGVNRFES